MSFIGTVPAELSRKTGNNRVGEPIYGETQSLRVGVVHLIRQIAKTSVRTDSSASRGNAEEKVATAKLLLPVSARPRNGDRLIVVEMKMRIENIEPRFDVFGDLDHYETTLVLWDDEEGD